jgi:hypothetical protein
MSEQSRREEIQELLEASLSAEKSTRHSLAEARRTLKILTASQRRPSSSSAAHSPKKPSRYDTHKQQVSAGELKSRPSEIPAVDRSRPESAASMSFVIQRDMQLSRDADLTAYTEPYRMSNYSTTYKNHESSMHDGVDDATPVQKHRNIMSTQGPHKHARSAHALKTHTNTITQHTQLWRSTNADIGKFYDLAGNNQWRRDCAMLGEDRDASAVWTLPFDRNYIMTNVANRDRDREYRPRGNTYATVDMPANTIKGLCEKTTIKKCREALMRRISNIPERATTESALIYGPKRADVHGEGYDSIRPPTAKFRQDRQWSTNHFALSIATCPR